MICRNASTFRQLGSHVTYTNWRRGYALGRGRLGIRAAGPCRNARRLRAVALLRRAGEDAHAGRRGLPCTPGNPLAQHRRLKTGVLRYLAQARLRNLISAPFIYAVFLPLLLVDLAVTGYQGLCFPLYGIPRVRRRDYFIFDRNSLAYLNIIEKFNCAYCAYATGMASYVKEIVGRTEQYWCPIKHARRVLEAHSRYGRFVDFGDAEAYRAELEAIRRDFPLPAAAAPVGANQDGNTEH